MPSFAKTFETLVSVVEIQLHTMFLCENDPPITGESDVETTRDTEWEEYRLPDLPSKISRGNRQYLSHTGIIHLDMRMPVSKSKGHVEHYLSDKALSPYLSLSIEPTKSFTTLDQTLRLEEKSQQVRSRYSTNYRHGRCRGDRAYEGCWRLNGGGDWMHAAKLWQGKVARELEAKGSHLPQAGRGKKASGGGLVLQS
jgi:hypothetical protein